MSEIPGYYFDEVKKKYFKGKAPKIEFEIVAVAKPKKKENFWVFMSSRELKPTFRMDKLGIIANLFQIKNSISLEEGMKMGDFVVHDKHLLVNDARIRKIVHSEIREGELVSISADYHLASTKWLMYLDIETGLLVGQVTDDNDIHISEMGGSLAINLHFHRDAINSSIFDQSKRILIGSKGSLYVIDWQREQTVITKLNCKKRDSDILALCSETKSNLIYYGSRSGHMGSIDTRSNACPFLVRDPYNSPTTCLVMDTSRKFYSGHLNGRIHLWDTRLLRRPLIEFESIPEFNSIKPFSFHVPSEYQDLLFAAGDSGLFASYSTVTGKSLKVSNWSRHPQSEPIQPISRYSKGSLYVSGKGSKTLCIYHIRGGF
jgi:WD40 repeat protein